MALIECRQLTRTYLRGAEEITPLRNLDLDIEEFTVWIRGIGLRYDYRDEPIESVDIPYTFQREVYYARHPRSEEG